MDLWVLSIYLLFFLAMGAGLAGCWREPLPLAQKLFWTIVILVFPIAGSLFFFLMREDGKLLLS